MYAWLYFWCFLSRSGSEIDAATLSNHAVTLSSTYTAIYPWKC
jgi:hypothetical protein